MLRFPIQDLMDYNSCYTFLEKLLHPKGLYSPSGHPLPKDQKPHKYSSTGLPYFKCKFSGQVFNLFTGTIFQGTHYDCITLVLMLRGIAQGVSTNQLHEELNINYKNLLSWRHLFQEYAYENRDWSMLTDLNIESDEVFINAGKKGTHKENPRKRANKKKG